MVGGGDGGGGADRTLLTGMFGGTPSKLAISGIEQCHVAVIAGINLPMLIKLASMRDTGPLAETVAAAQESGRKYINVASNLLTGADKDGN